MLMDKKNQGLKFPEEYKTVKLQNCSAWLFEASLLCTEYKHIVLLTVTSEVKAVAE